MVTIQSTAMRMRRGSRPVTRSSGWWKSSLGRLRVECGRRRRRPRERGGAGGERRVRTRCGIRQSASRPTVIPVLARSDRASAPFLGVAHGGAPDAARDATPRSRRGRRRAGSPGPPSRGTRRGACSAGTRARRRARRRSSPISPDPRSARRVAAARRRRRARARESPRPRARTARSEIDVRAEVVEDAAGRSPRSGPTEA